MLVWMETLENRGNKLQYCYGRYKVELKRMIPRSVMKIKECSWLYLSLVTFGHLSPLWTWLTFHTTSCWTWLHALNYGGQFLGSIPGGQLMVVNKYDIGS